MSCNHKRLTYEYLKSQKTVRGTKSFFGMNLPTLKSVYRFTIIKTNNFYLKQKIEFKSSKIKPNPNMKNEFFFFFFSLAESFCLLKKHNREAGSHVPQVTPHSPLLFLPLSSVSFFCSLSFIIYACLPKIAFEYASKCLGFGEDSLVIAFYK